MISRLGDARWTVRRWAVHACAAATVLAHLDERALSRLGPGGVLVLNLHSISPRTASLSAPVSPLVLDQLLGWLRRRCRVGTLQAGEAPARDDRPLAVLTFDDGYRDFLEYAMPILDRHAVRAIVNVVPACVDSGLPPWNVLLLHHLEHLPAERVRGIRLPGLQLGPVGRGHAARLRYAVTLSRFLKMRPRREREALVAELVDQIGDADGAALPPMLSPGDLDEVQRHHEIGLHSYEHDSMAFESDAFFRRDLERCLEWAAERFRVTPRVYAFPNGSARAAQVRIALEAGLGVVLLGGERPSRAGAHSHPRITPYGESDAALRMRIARGIYARDGLMAANGAPAVLRSRPWAPKVERNRASSAPE